MNMFKKDDTYQYVFLIINLRQQAMKQHTTVPYWTKHSPTRT